MSSRQADFFTQTSAPAPLDLPRAQLGYYPAWLDSAKASELMAVLSDQLQWSQPAINIVGKRLLIPRLQAWYGDAGAVMRYSGISMSPLDWHPSLLSLRQQLQAELGQAFNSVLANLYRDGSDSMGWHADNEKELGEQPFIVSISLGQSRRFSLKPLFMGAKRVDLMLEHGDMLTMSGDTQQYWHHAIPKTKKEIGARINLTFRLIK